MLRQCAAAASHGLRWRPAAAMFEDVSMKGPELQLVRASTYATLFASSASPRHTLTPWQFWQSLPVASKLLVVVVAAEACLWLGFISGNGASIATVGDRRDCTCSLHHQQVVLEAFKAPVSLKQASGPASMPPQPCVNQCRQWSPVRSTVQAACRRDGAAVVALAACRNTIMLY